MDYRPPRNLSVVAMEKGYFGSSSTKVANLNKVKCRFGYEVWIRYRIRVTFGYRVREGLSLVLAIELGLGYRVRVRVSVRVRVIFVYY